MPGLIARRNEVLDRLDKLDGKNTPEVKKLRAELARLSTEINKERFND